MRESESYIFIVYLIYDARIRPWLNAAELNPPPKSYNWNWNWNWNWKPWRWRSNGDVVDEDKRLALSLFSSTS